MLHEKMILRMMCYEYVSMGDGYLKIKKKVFLFFCFLFFSSEAAGERTIFFLIRDSETEVYTVLGQKGQNVHDQWFRREGAGQVEWLRHSEGHRDHTGSTGNVETLRKNSRLFWELRML